MGRPCHMQIEQAHYLSHFSSVLEDISLYCFSHFPWECELFPHWHCFSLPYPLSLPLETHKRTLRELVCRAAGPI